MYKHQRLQGLFDKFLSGTLNDSETKELDDWYAQSNQRNFFNEHSDCAPESMRLKLLTGIHQQLGFQEEERNIEKRGVRKLMYYAIAASLLIFLLAGLGIFYGKYTSEDNTHHIAAEQVEPARDKALIRLSNGKTVDLDSLKVGNSIQLSGIKVQKNKIGEIEYQSENNGTLKAAMTQIETPKGGKISLILPEGTQVELNAGSRLRFSQRIGLEDVRRVELEGEGFFHVAKVLANGKRKPFIVHTANQDVEVLGTTFNIQAYPNERLSKTTLVEGSVIVSFEGKSKQVFLKPGFQAVWNNNKKSYEIQSFDKDIELDWINGDFVFENEALTNVLNRVSRWYNIEIQYVKTYPNMTFYGNVSRKNSLAEVLNLLKKSANIRFRVMMDNQGRKTLVVE
ncbi:MAG: DUF4974 domain-containing protein [Sphingobacterium sp.]|jgi:ferric-dicitrate binding protein FerR (iron transport regulator)|nr:DUF4974 domain-containing protein [Sphingobacterium sp.]